MTRINLNCFFFSKTMQCLRDHLNQNKYGINYDEHNLIPQRLFIQKLMKTIVQLIQK